MARQAFVQQRRERSAETTAVIEARGLRKVFGTTVALDGIDLRVEEGRILGLIGPSHARRISKYSGLLIRLEVTAVFVVAAVRLRRYQGPI